MALALGLPASFFVASSIGWWLALVGALMGLIVVELLNTAIEELSDHVRPSTAVPSRSSRIWDPPAVFVTLRLAFIIWCAALAVRLSPAAGFKPAAGRRRARPLGPR